MNKADYDEIVRVIDWWWGGPTASLAHPVFFYELGKIARIMEVDGKMIGFLLGFLTAEPPPSATSTWLEFIPTIVDGMLDENCTSRSKTPVEAPAVRS